MKFQFQQAIRAMILLSFSLLLFKLHVTDELTKYINPKFEMLSLIAAILFLLFFFIQLTRIWETKEVHGCQHSEQVCNHDHGNTPFTFRKLLSYPIIVLPLVTGLLLPSKTLDASMAAQKGGTAILSKNQTNSETEADDRDEVEVPIQNDIIIDENPADPNLSDEKYELSEDEYDTLVQQLETISTIIMDDYLYNLYYEEISKGVNKYKGRTITLNGFVYKEDGFTQQQLVISRFLITHCVADAGIVGFLSEFDEASALAEDTWIEATGILDVTTYNGAQLPLIKITDWKTIDQPEEPYLYPLTVKLL